MKSSFAALTLALTLLSGSHMSPAAAIRLRFPGLHTSGNAPQSTEDSEAASSHSNLRRRTPGLFDSQGKSNNGKRTWGKIDVSNLPAAQAGAAKVLNELPNGRGKKFVPKNNNDVHHLRFVQTHGGMEVQGAAMMVHADDEGNVVGLNGQLVATGKLPITPTIGAGPAIKAALEESRIPFAEHAKCGPPALAVVRDPEDGSGHLAWTCTVRYDVQLPDGSFKPFKDQIFAEAAGDPGLVTLFPKIYSSDPPRSVRAKASSPGLLKGTARKAAPTPQKTLEKGQRRLARALETQDCRQKTRNCRTASTSSNTINTGDSAIDSAHNYAIATYDYFSDNFGRDSIDDNGMTLISRVHYDRNYNNAFWDGTQMTYGDGDGSTFVPLSQDADVVAHELTHGVTERSSGLIYRDESGALNEALSDIFGALVDRQEGATGFDIWMLGEDIYTPGTPGDALRYMHDPVHGGDYDWWPSRYMGSSDNGGVHWNSGIANLAFKLLVDGGSHPRAGEARGSDTIPSDSVNGIGFVAAADIFYNANVNCLTNAANFGEARYCTAMFGGANTTAVHAAWDAVGVPYDPPPPPNPIIEFDESNSIDGQSADTGNIQVYSLHGTQNDLVSLNAGETVTCTTTGPPEGDLDLYVAYNQDPKTTPDHPDNACDSYSSSSNEACTTVQAANGDVPYIALHAWTGYSGATLECTINAASSFCGDGTKNDSETCDGTDLGGQTCADLGCTGGGTLACLDGCSDFDTSGCTGCSGPACEPAGQSCGADSECCSNKCRGGNVKTCKGE